MVSQCAEYSMGGFIPGSVPLTQEVTAGVTLPCFGRDAFDPDEQSKTLSVYITIVSYTPSNRSGAGNRSCYVC